MQYNPGRHGTPDWNDIVVLENGPQLVAEQKTKYDNMGVYDWKTNTHLPSRGKPAYQWTEAQHKVMMDEVKKSKKNRCTQNVLVERLRSNFPLAPSFGRNTAVRELKRLGW